MPSSVYLNKVCLVTGGASGLGLELCRQLSDAGARVVLADIDEARAREAAAKFGGKVRAIGLDVTDAALVQAAITEIAAELQRIDYLFNNAGLAVIGEIRDLKLEHWRRVLEVNLFGEINCIHAVYPLMIRQRFGHIVNVASGFGLAPGPLNTPYVASKFAVYGLSHALAAEARVFGIRVSVVCPGFIQTALIDDLKPVNASGKDFMALMGVKPVPVKRAAQIVLAGVARDKMIIAFPLYVRILTVLHRMMPGVFSRISQKQVADFRKIRREPVG